ncbi:MAG: (d)CMP kinase, partial [Planctomycetes bacterium]|nr:(d)CMP kinase [Planctomycetota bacterium]
MTLQASIVTIDGPAGSGKSSVAQALADRLGFEFLDTGAMYRAVGWACLHRAIDPNDVSLVSELADRIDLKLQGEKVFVDGQDITGQIRTNEVSHAASVIARHPQVRESLVRLQRQFAAGKQIVSEGRDQGTVVFPDAACKFFLEARPEVRAERRHEQLLAAGDFSDLESLIKEIRERDERDANRPVAPLRPADDAERIDTSDL